MRSPLWVVLSGIVFAGCQSAPPPMSLDEAKTITADFQDQGFVPPPRTTVDIAALLEQAKPDTTALAARRAVADTPTPANAPASFFYLRGQALRVDGRIEKAIADLSEAVRLNSVPGLYRIRLADALQSAGYLVEAAQGYADVESGPSQALFATVSLAGIHMSLGDYDQADRDLDSARRRYVSFSTNYYAKAVLSAIEFGEGRLSKLRGNYVAAESLFRSSMADADWIVAHWDPTWGELATRGDATSGGSQKEANIQRSVATKRQIADIYRLRGMLNEAEYWVRRSLVQSIEMLGVNAPSTIDGFTVMSLVLADQGRNAEAQEIAELCACQGQT